MILGTNLWPKNRSKANSIFLIGRLDWKERSGSRGPMHNLTTRDFYAKILCKYLRGPEGSTKTIAENWDSKTPSVGTILAYFETKTYIIFL